MASPGRGHRARGAAHRTGGWTGSAVACLSLVTAALAACAGTPGGQATVRATEPVPTPAGGPAAQVEGTTGVAPWSVRMAESVMRRSPVVDRRWTYTAGLVLDAIERTGRRTDDARLLSYVRQNVDSLVRPDGSILTYNGAIFSLDEIEEGRIVLALWERTHDPRYRTAAATLRDQLRRQPRTPEGGFWHRSTYPQQMWLDGLYMAEPFYARWGRDFDDPAAFDDVAHQFDLVAEHLRDPATGLYRHGWDSAHRQPWADSATGVSRNFWGRALGWYAMALVDVLELLPPDHPGHARLLEMLRELAPALVRVQDPATGLWYQVLDQPRRAGNYLESSASSMFVYALAKGVRQGWLPPEYRAAAQKGFDGLVREKIVINADGTISLTGICEVAGLGGPRQRDGSFAYYISEPVVTDDYKGVGSFILAALELER